MQLHIPDGRARAGDGDVAVLRVAGVVGGGLDVGAVVKHELGETPWMIPPFWVGAMVIEVLAPSLIGMRRGFKAATPLVVAAFATVGAILFSDWQVVRMAACWPILYNIRLKRVTHENPHNTDTHGIVGHSR